MTPRLQAGACLSLSGRFAPFGQQAADGLRLWADHSDAELTVLDDESDPAVLGDRLPGLAARVNVLFGPYSTVLMRPAIRIAAEAGRLLVNHGGSGGALDAPGRVVNVLTPARRYAAPFVALLRQASRAPLFVATRRGTFGRDVVAGAEEAARAAGLHVETLDVDSPPAGTWDLLSAGVYEDDVATVRVAQALTNPPRYLCSVAAGVTQFADDVANADGILGIGQWAAGAPVRTGAWVGPTEPEFLRAWRDRFGGAPDYPGVQAYAAGAIAAAAAQSAGVVGPDALWRALSALDVRTVFGRFRLDAETGEQLGHESVLTEWSSGRQIVVPAS